jgi:ribosome production factor 2
MASPRKKPTGKAARYLTAHEPKVHEDTKLTLMLKGTRAGPLSGSALQALSHLISPHVKMLTRKNPNALPFDDPSSIEFLMGKNNCGLFAVASHSKKRPDNLTLGRSFDGRLLDMMEFHVESIQMPAEVSTKHSKRTASKPAMLFIGAEWEDDAKYRPLRNLLLDLFRGDDVSSVLLAGIDHVLVCAVVEGKVSILPHAVQFRRSGSQVPRVELADMGPRITMSIRRHQMPAPDLWSLACKQPKQCVSVMCLAKAATYLTSLFLKTGRPRSRPKTSRLTSLVIRWENCTSNARTLAKCNCASERHSRPARAMRRTAKTKRATTTTGPRRTKPRAETKSGVSKAQTGGLFIMLVL